MDCTEGALLNLYLVHCISPHTLTMWKPASTANYPGSCYSLKLSFVGQSYLQHGFMGLKDMFLTKLFQSCVIFLYFVDAHSLFSFMIFFSPLFLWNVTWHAARGKKAFSQTQQTVSICNYIIVLSEQVHEKFLKRSIMQHCIQSSLFGSWVE